MMREALIAAIEEFASQRYANYPAEKGAAFHSELFMLSGGLADAILALPVRSADGLCSLAAKDGAAAPPQAPVAGSEDSASEVAG